MKVNLKKLENNQLIVAIAVIGLVFLMAWFVVIPPNKWRGLPLVAVVPMYIGLVVTHFIPLIRKIPTGSCIYERSSRGNILFTRAVVGEPEFYPWWRAPRFFPPMKMSTSLKVDFLAGNMRIRHWTIKVLFTSPTTTEGWTRAVNQWSFRDGAWEKASLDHEVSSFMLGWIHENSKVLANEMITSVVEDRLDSDIRHGFEVRGLALESVTARVW